MSSSSTSEIYSRIALFVAYYPIGLIIFGTIANTLTFLTFCRAKFRDTNERPTLRYMRAIATRLQDLFIYEFLCLSNITLVTCIYLS
jgi:hypothetical protein